MNRGRNRLFHFRVESSFAVAVNAMWKMCKAGAKSGRRVSFTSSSEELGSDL